MLQLAIQRIGANRGDLHLNLTVTYTPAGGGTAGNKRLTISYTCYIRMYGIMMKDFVIYSLHFQELITYMPGL